MHGSLVCPPIRASALPTTSNVARCAHVVNARVTPYPFATATPRRGCRACRPKVNARGADTARHAQGEANPPLAELLPGASPFPPPLFTIIPQYCLITRTCPVELYGS